MDKYENLISLNNFRDSGITSDEESKESIFPSIAVLKAYNEEYLKYPMSIPFFS